MFCISGTTWGRIWPSEDSVFSWNRETHPSVLQVFPTQIPFPATRLPSALSWPRAHGETFARPHLHHCRILNSAWRGGGLQQIKWRYISENGGSFLTPRLRCICICRKIAFRKNTPPGIKTHIQAKSEKHPGGMLCIPKAFLSSSKVLELLCQILQTDSLTTVQQWLLLAGQRGNKPPTPPPDVAPSVCVLGSSAVNENKWQLDSQKRKSISDY